MASVQLSFSLRVSSGVKSVHLLGSWDSYQGQIPLSKDKSSSKSGSWKGTFRFQGNLQAGQRYWYYYIIDGYHVAHNPSEASTVEPTTSRTLNILDVPKDKKTSSSSSYRHSSSSKSSSKSSSSSSSSKSSKRGSQVSVDIPKGRPLSVSKIQSPKPISPNATRTILDADYDNQAIEELTARLGSAKFDAEDSDNDYCPSPVSSTGSSLSSRSGCSSPSSALSGYSTPASDISSCTCERYGITRRGDRVKIDCGGARCAFSDSEEDSSSDEEESYVSSNSRRNGIVVRS